ncbi:MAG: DUF1788 domain-containing protein [Anaerolineae bacterium]|nr:DUF1788 domain-containing protein [Anaerolineae bacterium]
MSSLKERVRTLEADLKASPMQHYIYHDLPFAIFCYPPDQEWAMRNEIGRLKTRLENDTDRTIEYIYLSELMWQAIDESEGIEAIVELERQSGFEEAQLQINDYLSDPDWRPLPNLLTERLNKLDPDRHLAFIVRAGVLSPNIYRVSKLLDEMKGRTRVPCVLFMPATTEGSGLRFMGIAENEGRGSYHTKVYSD